MKEKSKMALALFWVAGFVVLSALLAGELKFNWLEVVLGGLTVLRLGRMIAFDLVTEPWRKPLVKTTPDESGEGETTKPRYKKGMRATLGELLVCPVCVGTWVAAGVVYGFALFPAQARMFMLIISLVALAEIGHALIEALQWTGQANREKAGKDEIPSAKTDLK